MSIDVASGRLVPQDRVGNEAHPERHRRRRRRPNGLSEMEGVTLTLVIPKQLDLHQVRMIRVGIDQDRGKFLESCINRRH